MPRSDDEALADYLLAAETLVAHLEDTRRGPCLQALIDNCMEAREALFYKPLEMQAKDLSILGDLRSRTVD